MHPWKPSSYLFFLWTAALASMCTGCSSGLERIRANEFGALFLDLVPQEVRE